MSAPVDYRAALITLFRETFEGCPPGQGGTWFVQGKEGIFDAMDSVSAEQASFRASPGSSSIASQVDHTRYYMELANAEIRGAGKQSDWEASWARQTVNEAEWAQIKDGLRAEYREILRWFESNAEFVDQDWLTGGLAQVAHAAYHLGAIRQLLKLTPSTPKAG